MHSAYLREAAGSGRPGNRRNRESHGLVGGIKKRVTEDPSSGRRGAAMELLYILIWLAIGLISAAYFGGQRDGLFSASFLLGALVTGSLWYVFCVSYGGPGSLQVVDNLIWAPLIASLGGMIYCLFSASAEGFLLKRQKGQS